MKRIMRQFCIWLMILNTGLLGFHGIALAGDLGTETFLSSESDAGGYQVHDRMQLILAQEEVKEQLLEMGVDYADVQERVAALSDQELMALNGQMEELPAGAGLLGVIGVVFVVLLILEAVGVTNVFTAF